MEGLTPCWNKLLLPSLHLGGTPTGAGEGQLALVSWRSLDPASGCVAGRCTTSSSMLLTRTEIYSGLKLGSMIAASGGALRLQPCRMKMVAPDAPQSLGHAACGRSVHRLIKQIDWKGVCPDLGILVDPLFSQRSYSVNGNRWWTKVGHGVRDTPRIKFWFFGGTFCRAS